MSGYNRMEFHALQLWQQNSYELLARLKTPEGAYVFVKGDYELVPPAPGVVTQTRFAVLRDEEAQSLMDALWRAGVRPAQGSGTGAHVEAMKYHLEDMRKLVFDRRS